MLYISLSSIPTTVWCVLRQYLHLKPYELIMVQITDADKEFYAEILDQKEN